ncbi:hypothetical protein [Olivibacter sp. LS-1]|nr:hypothetical protein [Olivibacter sp. LS-1]
MNKIARTSRQAIIRPIKTPTSFGALINSNIVLRYHIMVTKTIGEKAAQ